MLKVLQKNKFTRTRKADADSSRNYTALVAVSNKVFAIAGDVDRTCVSTVSLYDIASNTWKKLSAKLNKAR